MPQVVENCILRTSFEFIQLARELLQTTPENMLGLQIMPDDNRAHDEYVLLKPRPFAGRVNWRGLNQNARPTRTPFAYEQNACIITPGYWAEFQEIDEQMIRKVAQRGTHSARFDLTDYERELMMDISMLLVWRDWRSSSLHATCRNLLSMMVSGWTSKSAPTFISLPARLSWLGVVQTTRPLARISSRQCSSNVAMTQLARMALLSFVRTMRAPIVVCRGKVVASFVGRMD
jgi:hypothetical protein